MLSKGGRGSFRSNACALLEGSLFKRIGLITRTSSNLCINIGVLCAHMNNIYLYNNNLYVQCHVSGVLISACI